MPQRSIEFTSKLISKTLYSRGTYLIKEKGERASKTSQDSRAFGNKLWMQSAHTVNSIKCFMFD